MIKTEITFDKLRKMLLYHKIAKWNGSIIVLDNGVEIHIEETDCDCCASAGGEFQDVVLDAAITNVSDIQYRSWSDGDTYGCSAVVTIVHNKNIICKAVADADAGNGGYYYSIASFVVKFPNNLNAVCHFVGTDDYVEEDYMEKES